MLDEFKTDILGSLSEQLDTLKIQNKQKTEVDALAIFGPKCRKKHALRECPLDAKVVETCMICSESHETKNYPSIPRLKAVFQEEPNSVESLCFVSIKGISRFPRLNYSFSLSLSCIEIFQVNPPSSHLLFASS